MMRSSPYGRGGQYNFDPILTRTSIEPLRTSMSTTTSSHTLAPGLHNDHYVHPDKEEPPSEKQSLSGRVPLRERIHHITWASYTSTMATGGIALVLHATPHRFHGLQTIGTIFFIFDLCLFLTFCMGISLRFYLFPGTLKKSLLSPTESTFVPCCWLSMATIISNTQNYGVPHCGPWLIVALRVLFWLYSALVFIASVAQYMVLITKVPLSTSSMTPAWILPIFPPMLAGTIASAIASDQPPKYALPILVTGLAFQGLGFMFACFMFAILIGRLMGNGLMIPGKRAGLFIAVGPPSFTGLAIMGMSSATTKIFPEYTTITDVVDPSRISDIFRVTALTFAIFLWVLAFWFFCLALVAMIAGVFEERMTFHLGWYSWVFPNVGFTVALIDIGQALESEGVCWVGSAMTILLVITYLFVMGAHIRAIIQGKIMGPGRDEDKDD